MTDYELFFLMTLVYTVISIVPLSIWFLYSLIYGKRWRKLRWWMQGKKWINFVRLDKDNIPSYNIKTVERKGNRDVIEDGNETYAYEPIAENLLIVEEGNSIPVIRGGYIEYLIKDEAKKKAEVGKQEVELDNEESEDTILKWAVVAGKLKHCIIRPLTRWSAREFREAIKAEVVIKMLEIPLSTMDIMIIVMCVAVMAVSGYSVYLGYQNQNAINEALKTLNYISSKINSTGTLIPIK